MKKFARLNAAELPSSRSASEQLTFNNYRQQIALYDTQEQMSHLKIEEEPPVTSGGPSENLQPSVVYHVEADRESEAEDIYVTHRPNNTVDCGAGVHHTEVKSVSNESESEGGMQESEDGEKSLTQYGNDIDNDPQDDGTTDNSLLPTDTTDSNSESSDSPRDWVTFSTSSGVYHDVHDEERDIFVDFDEDDDVEDEEATLVHQEDNKIEEEIGLGGLGFASINSRTTQIIYQHLSTPSQQSFTSLNDLLSSHNAPGRGLYSVEKRLEHEQGKAAELEEKMRYIEAELEEVRAQRDKANEIVRNAGTTFSRARGAARIHDDLWREYESFCESLEPKFGSRGGWSVTCFENHNGSYVKWDPNLDLFTETAEMPLKSCNFRCEATAIERKGRTEYVVEFWPLANPEPRSETSKTWRHQYPKLYILAEQATIKSHEEPIAKALLRSLPNPNLPFSGGWLFEYALEPGRAQHPTVSRRWSYHSACRIPFNGQQDQEDLTVLSQAESAASQDEKMEHDESEAAESRDIKTDDEESQLNESQDVEMEDYY